MQQQQHPSTYVAGQAFAPIPTTSPHHQQQYPQHHQSQPHPQAQPQPQAEPEPQAPKRKRLPDVIRVKKLTEELSAKVAQPEQVASGHFKRFRVDDKAHDSLLAYATEVAGAVLEEASLLAKHRQGDEVTIADLKLIFGKKYNIDAKGYQSRDKRRESLAAPSSSSAAASSTFQQSGDSNEAEQVESGDAQSTM